MRLMRHDDAQRVKLALNQLSPESRRQRYFCAVADFSDEMVAELVDIDLLKRWALLVVHIENGIEIPTASGHFLQNATSPVNFPCSSVIAGKGRVSGGISCRR